MTPKTAQHERRHTPNAASRGLRRRLDGGGFIMLMVMLMLVLCSLTVTSLMFRVRAESAAVTAAADRQQALAVALSGIRRAVAAIERAPDDPDAWRDNEELFRQQVLYDDGAVQWSFTVYTPDPEAREGIRYGVADEAEKLNLNSLDATTLAALGLLDSEQIDCLLDYIDADDEVLNQGAERMQYENLPTPYRPANAQLVTTEQALMVMGIGAAEVFGEDANHNGLLDPNEDDGDLRFPPDNADGLLGESLLGLTTAFSRDFYADQRKHNLNGADLLQFPLPAQALALVEAYRGDGNFFRHPIDLLEMEYTPIGASQALQSGIGPGDVGVIESLLTEYYAGPHEEYDPLNAASLPQRIEVVERARPAFVDDDESDGGFDLSALNAMASPAHPGGVNVMTAPAEVLQYVGDIGPNIAADIVDRRATLDPALSQNCVWLLTQQVLTTEQFKAAAPMLTARSRRYRVRSVGYGRPGGRFCVLEAVIDLSGVQARVAYLRDLTRLGMPFALADEDENRY